jgi:SAM-dependent methyltransferase
MTYDLRGYNSIEECRTCNSSKLIEVLDLGLQPLANELKEYLPVKSEIKYPLVLVGCENCKQLQLSINVDPAIMFKTYSWTTGTSETSKKHCGDLVELIHKKCNLTNEKILEIGSNDGTLLKKLRQLNNDIELIGVDPANNLFLNSDEYDIIIYRDFFCEIFAENFVHIEHPIDIIIARNVLSHVPDLTDVLRGIKKITHKDSILIFEFHSAATILSELHFDSIYHEHTYYHTLNSFSILLKEIGFYLNDLVLSPISGGSNIIFASKNSSYQSASLKEGLYLEDEIGIKNQSTWTLFANQSKRNIADNSSILQSLISNESCAYGASARSSTLLNVTDASSANLSGIADLNSLKWGKFSPGLHLPINQPEVVINPSIKNVFICAFNFEDEIVRNLKENIGWSGNIIVPLPNQPRQYKI